MADLSTINVGKKDYQVKDSTARSELNRINSVMDARINVNGIPNVTIEDDITKLKLHPYGMKVYDFHGDERASYDDVEIILDKSTDPREMVTGDAGFYFGGDRSLGMTIEGVTTIARDENELLHSNGGSTPLKTINSNSLLGSGDITIHAFSNESDLRLATPVIVGSYTSAGKVMPYSTSYMLNAYIPAQFRVVTTGRSFNLYVAFPYQSASPYRPAMVYRFGDTGSGWEFLESITGPNYNALITSIFGF